MAVSTSIEWADHTANFWEGCTQVSPACDFCYAKTRAERFGTVDWNGPPRQVSAGAATVRKAQRIATDTGVRQVVFVNSLSDFFDKLADPQWRREALSEMLCAPHCDFLILTKRIGNAVEMIEAAGGLPPNVSLGITVANQPEADRDIPKLLAAKVALKIGRVFLSIEPMLGPVDVSKFMWPVCAYWPSPYQSPEAAKAAGAQVTYKPQSMVWAGASFVDWVICGGESGAKARPMHPDWARSLRDQCAAAGVPFFFKQWGEWAPDKFLSQMRAEEEESLSFIKGKTVHEFDDGSEVWRAGKARAGRLLDGVEHNARPALHEVDGRKGEDGLLATTASPGRTQQ